EKRLATERGVVTAAGDDGSAEPRPERPGRLAAVIKESEVAQPAAQATTGAVDSVPWAGVDSPLLPGGTLKDQPRPGLAWLWSHHERGAPGVLLADDMGLGK